MELVDRVWKPPSPVRLLNVTALALTEQWETYEQQDLFTPPSGQDARQERLESAVDAIRRKYGAAAISYGNSGGTHTDSREEESH